MTMPSAHTLEREKDKLYLTDAELYRRLGVPRQTAAPVIQVLEDKQGFPKRQKLWGNRRYWPAVKAWLDRNNGLQSAGHPPTRGNP